jgi:hypothetical protein
MPAASEPPALPYTFRPLGVRIAVIAFGGVLFLVTAVIWLAFPPEIQAKFTLFQRLTVIAIGLAVAVAGYALARSRIVARDDEVVVVNGYKTRRLEWNQVVAVSLTPGSPWAVLDLADGPSVPAMGIQGSDGSRATAQVRRFRLLLDQKTRTEQDD